MEKNPLNRIKLMMSYDMGKTLNENVNKIQLNVKEETEVEEQINPALVRDLKKASTFDEKIPLLSSLFGVSDDVVKNVIGKDLTTLSKEVEKAITKDIGNKFRGNGAALGPAAKEVSKQQAIKEILSTNKKLTEKEIIAIIERIKSTNKQKAAQIEAKITSKEAKNLTDTEKKLIKTKAKLKNSKAKIKDLENQIKNQANRTNVGTKSEAVNNVESTVKQAEQDVAQVMNTNKSRLRNMSETAYKKFNLVKKSLAAKWLVSLGIVGAGGYYISNSLFGGSTKPDGTNTIHSKCITDLLDDDGASVGVTSSGDPVVVVKKTGNPDYDKSGGLMFFINGRVVSVDNKMRGNWSCNVNSSSVNEDININEQINDKTMDSDVNKMINLLDFPVTGGNLQDAIKLLTKYANNSRGKEFLDLYSSSGYGGGDLKKSLDYIFTTEPSSVRAKRTLYNLVSKIEGGDNNKSTGIGNIKIVWDGAKKNTNTNTGSNTGTNTNKKPKKSRYKDCSSFPFDFGCRSPLIGEIQKCIGVSPSHGNFGPWTLKALEDLKIDTSNGITALIYDTIMNSCGEIDSSLTQSEKPTQGQNPMSLANLVDEPKKSVETPSVTPRDANKFYMDLANSGYIAKVDDIDGKNRIKYKGPDLSNEDLGLLDTVMNEKGYDRIKQVDKKYGSKYVYLKRD